MPPPRPVAHPAPPSVPPEMAHMKADGMSSKDSKDSRKRKAEIYLQVLQRELLQLPTPCDQCARDGRNGREWVLERCFVEGHLMSTIDQQAPTACCDCRVARPRDGACATCHIFVCASECLRLVVLRSMFCSCELLAHQSVHRK